MGCPILTLACTTACAPTSLLPSLVAASWTADKRHAVFVIALYIIIHTDAGVEITKLIQLTRVTGSEELIRVVSGISPAKRFGRC